MNDRLSLRALNRATLARQLLLRRQALPVADALERLVGLQAQATDPPYVALWTRLDGFAFADLDRLLTSRQVVRAAAMRGTLHLMTARDYGALRPILQPVFDRTLLANHGRLLAGLDLDAVAAAACALLTGQPMSYAALGKALQQRWPDRAAAALAAAARNHAALVQAPPALWGDGRPPRMTDAQSWLGRPLATDTAPGPLVLRYLAAFGPAGIADIRTWCGLTGVAEIVEDLGARVRRFQGPEGETLFDLPEAPHPDPETPAPARLLGGFDNLLLSHADRRRLLDERHRAHVATVNGIFHPTLLIDGRIAGTWKLATDRKAAQVTMTPFALLAGDARDALNVEAAGLLAAAAPGLDPDVRWMGPAVL